MAKKPSAGILLYRHHDGELQVLLVHPGGPMWARRDAGAWSIPKGEHETGEDALAAARREFAEELGSPAPDGDTTPLGWVRQRSGKVVTAWALQGDIDAGQITSNTCMVQWPPRSGREIEIPEVDRAEWFDMTTAREKINPAQTELLERLESLIAR